MNLDILKNNAPVEVWAPFGEDEVLIRHISREELQALYRKATRTTFVNHQKKDELDTVMADKLLGCAVVRDWKGFTMDGQPLPCNEANIGLLMTRWTAFARFVNDTCTDLDYFMTHQQDQTRKNSSITSGPDATTPV